MIEFRQVSKSFGSRRVLEDISFQVHAGEIVFVMGRSGAGKSVLLKNIVGLLRPDHGEVWVDGQRVDHLSEPDFFSIRRHCGMIFQQPALLDSLPVHENLAFGLRAHRLCSKESEVDAKLKEAIGRVGLTSRILWKFPNELSFSAQKKVSLARTLVLEPKYLLFDEPTTSLDPVGTRMINELIRKLSQDLKVTSVVVSHDMHCAIQIADRIILLDQGRVVMEGAPRNYLTSDQPLARLFVEEARARLLDTGAEKR